jgi:hypothetical protein
MAYLNYWAVQSFLNLHKAGGYLYKLVDSISRLTTKNLLNMNTSIVAMETSGSSFI